MSETDWFQRKGSDFTSSSIEAPSTSFTFEVLCLLMVDKDLKIVKVPFAIVAPRSTKDFFNVGMTALFLCHVEWSDTESLWAE